jgi:hypothetical protein
MFGRYPVLAFSYYIFFTVGKIELTIQEQEQIMNTCPKIDNCYKVTMVLDKDYSFDWQYASALQKVCHNCLAGVSTPSLSEYSENDSVVPCVKPTPQFR